MKINHYAILLLFFVSFIASAASDQEADRWYQVEIIMFSHQDDPEQEDEQFPVDPGQPMTEHSIELAPAPLVQPAVAGQAGGPLLAAAGTALVMPYQLLTDSAFQLNGMVDRLTRSGHYVPQLHLAWRQPAFVHKIAVPVHIHWQPPSVEQEPVAEVLAVPPDSSANSDNNNELISDSDAMTANAEKPTTYLDGLITVSANRYLHLDLDLVYGLPPSVEQEAAIFKLFGFAHEEAQARVFRMVQSRRLRSGEYHYFDHPHYGLIALVTPYNYPVRAVEKDEAVPGEQQPVPPLDSE